MPRTTTERSNHEEEGAHRKDRRGGWGAQERGTEALRGLRGGGDRSAQGWRGGPDHGLREVLRKGAQGQGGQEPPDRPEDEDRRPEGSRLQRGQRPQRGGLRAVRREFPYPRRWRSRNLARCASTRVALAPDTQKWRSWAWPCADRARESRRRISPSASLRRRSLASGVRRWPRR